MAYRIATNDSEKLHCQNSQCHSQNMPLDQKIKVDNSRHNSCHKYKVDTGQELLKTTIYSSDTNIQQHVNHCEVQRKRAYQICARAVEGDKNDIEWYHKNYLDHVYAVSDDNGSIDEHYRYTAFGEVEVYSPTEVKLAGSAIGNSVMWNSRRFDQTTGLHYYKYRHYAPQLGRWLGRDPLGCDAFFKNYLQTKTSSRIELYNLKNELSEEALKNLYLYCDNDSLNNSDQYGLAVKAGAALLLLKCGAPHFIAAKLKFPKDNGKMQHCWTSCKIAKDCGNIASGVLGLMKEGRDVAVAALAEAAEQLGYENPTDFGDRMADVLDDMKNNDAGIKCAGWKRFFKKPIDVPSLPSNRLIDGISGLCGEETCESCCKRNITK